MINFHLLWKTQLICEYYGILWPISVHQSESSNRTIGPPYFFYSLPLEELSETMESSSSIIPSSSSSSSSYMSMSSSSSYSSKLYISFSPSSSESLCSIESASGSYIFSFILAYTLNTVSNIYLERWCSSLFSSQPSLMSPW